MLFNSIRFMFFFPIVLLIYFLLPQKHKWKLLLVASYYFYMCWKVEYIFLIVLSTVIDYCAAINMEKHPKHKKKYLLLSLFSNLGLLFLFKYYNFFSGSLDILFSQFNIMYDMPSFKLLLPVGISFYTFQTLSYTIDVYKGKTKAEKHFGIFALYVSFFPQLVAGPIERSSHLLPQFKKESKFSYDNIVTGLRQMLWGMFKKIVIADRVALYVNAVYNNPNSHSGTTLLVATYLFAIQIYCDFSGYSDIAIGAARTMGYDLMQNFKAPYFAKNIAEFWHRWHISLSTWFKDYVYIPLGGNRVSRTRKNLNLAIVFFTSGLWHGANYTFIAWGVYHGILHILADVTKNIRKFLWQQTGVGKIIFVQKTISFFITLNLVCLSWIFFRANSLSDALLIWKKIFTNLGGDFFISVPRFWIYIVSSVFVLILVDIKVYKTSLQSFYNSLPTVLRWAFYLVVSYMIIIMGVFDASSFIYFQF